MGLTAEFPFYAYLARNSCGLIGKDRERFRHAVDRVGELRDFAFRFNEQLLFQIAIRD